MKRSKRIYILLGVLAVVCLATFAAIKFEERQEQIRTSEEVILELAAEEVQSLSWSYGDTTLSFTRNESGNWRWDEDEAFPVNEEKMNELLEQFSAFSVSFAIEEVADYSQYGLDTPACTIILATAEQEYTLTLGDFSKLDSQRYVSIGDGNAYLVSTDPMETYEITIKDIIEHDKALDYDAISAIRFTGAYEWSIDYLEDSTNSVCEEDVYFTDGLPLDTDLVDSYLDDMTLTLNSYVSYNATEEELETYGLNDPELSITVDYTIKGETEEDEDIPGSYTLHISRSAEQRAMTEEEEEELTSWAAYARVGESQILYQIGSSVYEALMAADYNDLRHKEVFTADFSLVTAVDIELEGNSHSLTTRVDEEDGETLIWLYGEQEIEITGIRSGLKALSAARFTEEVPTGQQEIKLTLHLEHEYFPEMEIVLYRCDGTNCLAVVDGESFALVSRSDVVDLIESVNAIVLN